MPQRHRGLHHGIACCSCMGPLLTSDCIVHPTAYADMVSDSGLNITHPGTRFCGTDAMHACMRLAFFSRARLSYTVAREHPSQHRGRPCESPPWLVVAATRTCQRRIEALQLQTLHKCLHVHALQAATRTAAARRKKTAACARTPLPHSQPFCFPLPS